jgi:D-serine deaminase-like pyridoxal phosphate-dependent protein
MRAAYFTKLQKALAAADLAEPVLLLDRQRLDKNIKQLKRMLPKNMAYRIVAKSLPSAPLLKHIADKADTNRLMSFNRVMSEQILAAMPKADQLLGKPLPVAAAAALFDGLAAVKGKQAARQMQWLVDTPTRLKEYEALAAKLKLKLRVNLEIDVGLHRGGMMPGPDLEAALARLAKSKNLSLAGYLGYEPHLSKIPNIGGWRRRAKQGAAQAYGAALAQGRAHFTAAHIEGMVRNMAGSPTFGLYQDTALANELAAGSALVKPSDFDMPMLKDFEPAAFIATPALKVSQEVRLPALEYASKMLGKPKTGTGIFIHGGYWMADAVWPKGLKTSGLFGRSSNQEFLLGPKNLPLKPDAFVFLRPTQSEAIFLQFPKIAVFDGRCICDIWQPLPVSA